jgi:hypothetical protein
MAQQLRGLAPAEIEPVPGIRYDGLWNGASGWLPVKKSPRLLNIAASRAASLKLE